MTPWTQPISFPPHAITEASEPIRPLYKMQRVVQWSNQILSDIMLLTLKTSFMEGNPLSQGLYQGVLQIVFQGGLNASWNGKGSKACLCVCVCVCMVGWVVRVSTSANLLALSFFKKLLNCFSKLTVKRTIGWDLVALMSNKCFMFYKYTLLYIHLLMLYSNSSRPTHKIYV